VPQKDVHVLPEELADCVSQLPGVPRPVLLEPSELVP
jgi:hypothetical protein